MIEIPLRSLEKDTLIALIEAFVLREGTDYGEQEVSLDKKVNDIYIQLEAGELKILYDEQTESCNIVNKEHLAPFIDP